MSYRHLFSFLVLGFGLLMSLTCGASPQLEALKDDWAAEKLVLPQISALRKLYGGILWSGFSLGTELMMSTALLDNGSNDLFVYNDFLCRSKERLIVLNHEPNGLRNITPEYFLSRDFPERMLALSDHRILFTEGGLDRDLEIVRSIFPENVTAYHQPRFATIERYRGDELPRHLSLGEYFALCNVDPTNHYYKIDLVKAWLDGRLLD